MITSCLLVLFAAPSDDAIAQARLFFESGRRAYQQAEYEAAIAAFEQAHEVAPRPALYFSMAQAYRLQFFVDGRVKGLRNAGRLYAKYLAEDPKGRRRADAVEHLAAVETILIRRGDDADENDAEKKTQLMVSANVDATVEFAGVRSKAPLIQEVAPGAHTATVSAPGYRPQIVRRMAVKDRLVVAHVELEEQPATVSVIGENDAELRIDGKKVGTIPVLDLALSSGDHRVQVLASGKKPVDQIFTVQRGVQTEWPIEMQDTAQRTGAYWMLGSGGAGAAVGGVFLTLSIIAQNRALNIQNRLLAGENLTTADIQRFQDQQSNRDDYAIFAGPLLVGAALTLTIGALLYVLDTPTLED